MKILSFGAYNIDFVYKLPHITIPGETQKTDAVFKYPGGKGLNQSIAIARSGAKVFCAGCIGPDGQFLKALLQEARADVSYIKTIEEPTGHAIIQVDENGENSIFICSGANGKNDVSYINSVLGNFGAGDVIVLQNEIDNLEYIIDKAYEKEMKVVLNPSPFNDNLKKIDLNKIFLLILNEIEAENWSGEKKPYAMIKYFNTNYKGLNVLLTLGKDGSVFSNGEENIFCSAFKIKAVDTTGAGDTFAGYFISELLKNGMVEKGLRIASAAAALAISKTGAASSIPCIAEVKKAVRELTPATDKKSFELNRETEAVYHYIQNNIATANMKDVADILGFNRDYMSIWIKKHLGKSFTEILLNFKCEAIAEMLAETELPISEIINAVGYQNEGFIRNKFAQKYGISLKAYRQKMKA